jgi:hypothetical protein
MQNAAVDPNFFDELLSRIREGLVEGVRQEVERRCRLGIPLYISRNGGVEAVMPDAEPPPKTPLPNLAESR